MGFLKVECFLINHWRVGVVDCPPFLKDLRCPLIVDVVGVLGFDGVLKFVVGVH